MKLVLSLIVLVALILVSVVVGPSFVDWNAYKDQLTQKVALVSGLDVTIAGDVSLAILPSPRVYIEDVTVSNPQAKEAQMASFQMLDVRVGLAALLNKRIEVTTVRLEQPVVRLVQDERGRFNFMTTQIEAMKNLSGAGGDVDQASDLSISFDGVEIVSGSFSYHTPSTSTELEKLNFDLQASSLSGPFKGQGDFIYNGKRVELGLKTGVLDAKELSTSLNLNTLVDGIALDFAGVVSAGADVSAQGEVLLTVPSVGDVVGHAALKGDLKVQGILSADAKGATLKDVALGLGGYDATGRVAFGFAPLSVDGAFESRNALNLDQLLGPKGSGGAMKSPLALAASLPQVVELPQMGDVELSLSLPSVIYNAQSFNDVSLVVTKATTGFGIKARLPKIAGEGRVHIDAGLNFAEKSSSGNTKTDIYSGPSVDVVVKGQAQNLPLAVKALSGVSDLPLVRDSKVGVFEFDGTMSALGLFLNKGVINLDNDAYSINGSLKDQKDSGADLLKVKVVADFFDVDRVLNGSSGSKAKQGSGRIAPPFDVEIDAQVHKVLMQGQTVSGLGVRALYKDEKLSVKQFEVDDFSGHTFALNGAVSVDMAGAKPYLMGDIDLGDFVWDQKHAKAQKTSGAKWSSEPIASGWLKSMDMDMAVKANSILYQGWALSKPSIKVSMKDGALFVKSLNAGLYDGQIAASGQLRSMANDAGLTITGKAQVDKVNMEPLVKSLAGTQILKGLGSVSLNVDLNGAGASMNACMSSLVGQGAVSGSGIVLDGVDINRFARALSEEAKPGDTVLNLWKGTTGRGSTSFDTLDGAYVINEGVVDLQRLLLDGVRASIDTTGKINLPQWTVQTAHKMTVKDREDVPPFTVNISGSLDNPGQTFAQGALNDYLSRKIQRKLDKVLGGKIREQLGGSPALNSVLQGVLGGVVPSQPTPANDNATSQPQEQEQQAPQEVRPEDVVEDLLKGFLR